jgi:co-chaperonin GroES (HSP10)
VGDYVIFGKYNSGGEPIEIDGVKYLMCREGDIGGVSTVGPNLRVRLAVD